MSDSEIFIQNLVRVKSKWVYDVKMFIYFGILSKFILNVIFLDEHKNKNRDLL